MNAVTSEFQALAVVGPTASGKTALALRLAQKIPCEIISMDSALVYRGMDIGTAKPTPGEMAALPHHLIDIRLPTENYNAADFVADAGKLITDIRARGKLPLIVGGTMMYFTALTQGLSDLPAADPGIRAQLRHEKETLGAEALYRELCRCDPTTAARLHPNDSQRIERALEIFRLTGKAMSAREAPTVPNFAVAALILCPQPRALLHQGIAQRFRRMADEGFVDEVRRLRREYPELTAEHPAMRAVGYRQAWACLDGLCDEPTFIERGIAATRQLAKRQITRLRAVKPELAFNPAEADENTILEGSLKLAEKILPR